MYKKASLVFAFVVLLFCLLLYLPTRQMPVLSSGDSVPSDIRERQYALYAVPQSDTQGTQYIYRLHSTTPHEVSLVLSNAEHTSVQLNGQILFENDPSSTYSRVIVIPLTLSGQSEIAIRIHAWSETSREIFSNTASTMPHVIIGNPAIIARSHTWFLAINMLCIGMYVFMILNSMVLYSCKRSENYLIHLALVAASTMLLALVNANVCLIPMSNQMFAHLRPVIAYLPVMLNIGLYFSLLHPYIPTWFRRFNNLKALSFSTALLITADVLFHRNLHYLFVFLMILPVMQTFCRAIARKAKDAYILLLGYGAGISVIIEVMFYHAGILYGTNPLNSYMSVVQLNYFLNLLCCSIAIGRRFSRKFQDAECLTEQLSEANAHLEETVAQRTQSLRDEQERKHNMMMNIFHDLRSPIFVLEGRLNDFNPQTQTEADALLVMRSRLSYLHRLIEDLFLTAKLESGSVIFDEQDVNLNKTLEHVVHAQQTAAQSKHVTLSFETSDSATVWGDPQRLEQVFQNLVENALHHAPENSVIRLIMYNKDTFSFVDVIDCGNGIPAEDLDKIFERYFYRKRKGTSSSGLGLSIAKEIVTAHQGSLCVTSNPGKGATFTVCLPLCSE